MHVSSRIGGLLLILCLGTSSRSEGPTPAEILSGLKQEGTAIGERFEREYGSGKTEGEKQKAVQRFEEKTANVMQRLLDLARRFPDSAQAPEALALVYSDSQRSGSFASLRQREELYDLFIKKYLDSDFILPVCRIAWSDAAVTVRAGEFLRAAAERSQNTKVRGLACLSLAKHAQELVEAVQDLDHPVWGKTMIAGIGDANIQRLRALKVELLREEAEALFARTIAEFSDLRPLGKDFAPLGEQAEGALFRLRNLMLGCSIPEIAGEDVEGRAMKLSDFRGKVVVISFWATWCGPCMGMVPDEKALVERMRGRPFVLIGVNGDAERDRAKAVQTEMGINWRSFWDGGRLGEISVKWGVNAWPTIYVIDANGRIRDHTLRGAQLDEAVEKLVTEAEALQRKPR